MGDMPQDISKFFENLKASKGACKEDTIVQKQSSQNIQEQNKKKQIFNFQGLEASGSSTQEVEPMYIVSSDSSPDEFKTDKKRKAKDENKKMNKR